MPNSEAKIMKIENEISWMCDHRRWLIVPSLCGMLGAWCDTRQDKRSARNSAAQSARKNIDLSRMRIARRRLDAYSTGAIELERVRSGGHVLFLSSDFATMNFTELRRAIYHCEIDGICLAKKELPRLVNVNVYIHIYIYTATWR